MQSPLWLTGLIFAIACLLVGVALWFWRRAGLAESKVAALTLEATTTKAALEQCQVRLLSQASALARAEERASRVEQLESALSETQDAAADTRANLAALSAEAAAREAAFGQQIAQLEAMRDALKLEFGALAQAALRSNEQTFLRLANETFAKHREGAAADLGKTRTELSALLQPVQETLTRYQQNLGELERQRASEQGALKEQLTALAEAQGQVKAEAARLTQALRSNSQVRGAWGEQQLRNVLEMAGLSAHADFETQVSRDGEDGKLRPDVVVRMPGGRQLVIDAKTPLAAYLDAAGADQEADRAQHLTRHARALKEHVTLLSQKKYWEQFEDAPDYVVMFIPGEHFVAAALDYAPDLWTFAFDRKVLIATPTNLIALARTVAQIWRQERLGETARQIALLGQDLYKRMVTLGERVVDLGKSLDRSVGSYNRFVATLEGSVLPHARKFSELGVEGSDAVIPDASPSEQAVRLPSGGRDLLLAPSDPQRRDESLN
jgi:DNA recombination protein RmuC